MSLTAGGLVTLGILPLAFAANMTQVTWLTDKTQQA
jgi:hypothetical protein